MNIDPLLFFAIPIAWILSALLARYLLIYRGYPQAESWLPGCLLGPLGVLIAVLAPRESPQVRYLLQFTGWLFVLNVVGVSLLIFASGALRSNAMRLGVFILFEAVVFLIARAKMPGHEKRPGWDPAARVKEKVSPEPQWQTFSAPPIDPVQESGSSRNECWIQSGDYSLKIYPLVDARESIRVYRAHDWARELALLDEMKARQQDYCEPGIGFIRDTGRFLHICHGGAGRLAIYFQPATMPEATARTFRDLAESDLEVAIEAFYSGEDSWFKANTSYGS